jgi:hypothetical protein
MLLYKSNAFKNILLGIITLLAITACQKDPPKPVVTNGEKFENGAFIICEGNFTYGNASVSFLHRATMQVETGLFKKINGYPLGDVFESMYADGQRYYMVVNNSQKIEVVNAADFKSAGSITGFNSPRYYLAYKDKAFVSDLGANGVWDQKYLLPAGRNRWLYTMMNSLC